MMDRRTFSKSIAAAATLPWWWIKQQRPAIDLSLFTDPEMDGIESRLKLDSPWHVAGITFASDGRWGAWTNAVSPNSEDEKGEGKRPSLGGVPIQKTEQLKFCKPRFDRIKQQSQCPDCFRKPWEQCHCEGGMDSSGLHWCRKCDGDGWHRPCDRCKATACVDYAYRFAGRSFSAAYVEQLQRQPDLEAAVICVHSESVSFSPGCHALAFRSHDAQLHGLLMELEP